MHVFSLPVLTLDIGRRLADNGRMYGAAVGVSEHAARGRSNCHLYHYAGNNPVRYIDPDGRFPTPKMFYDAFKSLKDSSAVNRILRFAKSCEYKLYVDFCVGGGVSADALGLGIGGDIGSEHATLSLKSENGEPFNFDCRGRQYSNSCVSSIFHKFYSRRVPCKWKITNGKYAIFMELWTSCH